MLIAAMAAGFGLRPTPVSGQTGSFRVLGGSYVLVGESIYHADPANAPVGWHAMPYGSFTLPPVQASTLVSLTNDVAITDTGEGWIFTGTGPNGWTDVGPIPGVVGVQRTSWGAVKAKYR